MNIVNVNDIKEFQMQNLHSTGESYISALENEIVYPSIIGVEEVMKLLKSQMTSFKNEKTGTFKRWEYFNIHFSRNMYECLKNNNVNEFKNYFKNSNTIEISEVNGKYFDIIVTRKSDNFKVVIKTYAYIGINESAIQYLDEEQAKLMIARKLYLLKKNE